jgi:hypothetical protein
VKPLLLAAVTLVACTEHNPAFETLQDGAGQSFDLAGNAELDLAVPDLEAADLSLADLRPVRDLAVVLDQRQGDALVPCGDALCPGCCVAGVCLAVGQMCSGTGVCTPNGCQTCGNLTQACCSGRNCNGNLFCETNTDTCGACGRPGQRCCNGVACAAGGCCANALCVPDGRACTDGQICLEGACTACGTDGQTCCADNACKTATSCCNPATRSCVSSGTTCGAGSCASGSCGGCGANTQSCCSVPDAGAPACSGSHTVCGVGSQCATCGADGQSCCGGNSCNAGGCCVNGTCRANATSCASAGGMCAAGSCGGGTCGGPQQACCNGGTCTAPDTRCVIATCRPCGGRDQICCFDAASNTNTFCEPPYRPVLDVTATCHCRTG